MSVVEVAWSRLEAEHGDGPVTVAVVDDHVLVRDGLAQVAAGLGGFGVVRTAGRIEDLLDLPVAPRVLLLDLDLDGTPADEMLVARLVAAGVRVLVVSALADPATVRAMLRAGVAGFVSKRESAAQLAEAIVEISHGGEWTSSDLAAVLARDSDPDRPVLSEQEARALMLYASGLKLASVARQMNVKPATAKEYIERVRAKYTAVGRPAPSKFDLSRNAVQDGILPG